MKKKQYIFPTTEVMHFAAVDWMSFTDSTGYNPTHPAPGRRAGESNHRTPVF